MPWVKGQSGNPGGTPHGIAKVAALARTHTEGAIATLAEIMTNPKNKSASRVKAAEVLLNRAWGQPKQDLTVSDPDGNPIAVHHYVVRAPLPVESAQEWIQQYAPPVPQLTDE